MIDEPETARNGAPEEPCDGSGVPFACGGRREARRLARRETILDVAQESFLRDGYAGTTMSAIAASLGGSKGTLWNYFPAKPQLFAAVVDRASARFQARLGGLLDPALPVADALCAFTAAFLGKIASTEGLALRRLIVGEAGRFPEIGAIFQERAAGRMAAIVAEFLSGHMVAGRLRRGDPLVAAQQLLALARAGHYQSVLNATAPQVVPAWLAADAHEAVRTFLRAWHPDAPEPAMPPPADLSGFPCGPDW